MDPLTIGMALEATDKINESASKIAGNMAVPLYEKVFDDGSVFRVTPTGIVAVGGGLALFAIGKLILEFVKEGEMSFWGGGTGIFSGIMGMGLGSAGAPMEIITDLVAGKGAAGVVGNLVKYSNPVFMGADFLGVPVDETTEKLVNSVQKKFKKWF